MIALPSATPSKNITSLIRATKPKPRMTRWISMGELKPTREGWYDTKSKDGLEHGNRHFWQDGEFWEFGVCAGILKVRRAIIVSYYRGLVSKCPA